MQSGREDSVVESVFQASFGSFLLARKAVGMPWPRSAVHEEGVWGILENICTGGNNCTASISQAFASMAGVSGPEARG